MTSIANNVDTGDYNIILIDGVPFIKEISNSYSITTEAIECSNLASGKSTEYIGGDVVESGSFMSLTPILLDGIVVENTELTLRKWIKAGKTVPFELVRVTEYIEGNRVTPKVGTLHIEGEILIIGYTRSNAMDSASSLTVNYNVSGDTDEGIIDNT